MKGYDDVMLPDETPKLCSFFVLLVKFLTGKMLSYFDLS